MLSYHRRLPNVWISHWIDEKAVTEPISVSVTDSILTNNASVKAFFSDHRAIEFSPRHARKEEFGRGHPAPRKGAAAPLTPASREHSIALAPPTPPPSPPAPPPPRHRPLPRPPLRPRPPRPLPLRRPPLRRLPPRRLPLRRLPPRHLPPPT